MNGIHFDAMQQTIDAMRDDQTLHMSAWQATTTWRGGTKHDVSIRHFPPITIDEPTELGGTNEGPNPIELLISSAVSCFAITVSMVASEMGLAIESLQVTIDAQLNAAVFLGIAPGDGGIQHPVLTLDVVSEATVEQLEGIAQVALNRSPVLLSMHEQFDIVVRA